MEARLFPGLPCEPQGLRSDCMANALAETDSKTLFNDIEIAFFRQDIMRKLMILFLDVEKNRLKLKSQYSFISYLS